MIERLSGRLGRTLCLSGGSGMVRVGRIKHGETETRQLSPPGRYGDKMV